MLNQQDGNTPLDMALSYGKEFRYYEVVKLLKVGMKVSQLCYVHANNICSNAYVLKLIGGLRVKLFICEFVNIFSYLYKVIYYNVTNRPVLGLR